MVPEKSHAFCGTYEMCERSSACDRRLTSTPPKDRLPDVTSLKRSSILAMVDLPEPVLPMMAVVWARRKEKSTSCRVSSSASEKRRPTWSKRATSSPTPSRRAHSASSAISGARSRTSAERVRHAMARGTDRMAICAIIMQNMMSMACSTRAVMEPICMA